MAGGVGALMPDLLAPLDPAGRHDPGCKLLIRLPADTRVSAVYGGVDGCYRYSLEQVWDADKPRAMVAMMNPSAAGESYNDMTVAKTGRIFRRLGYGSQVIVNACAYRATDRMRLLEVDDPVGPLNMLTILGCADRCALVVVAHGRLPGGLQRHADAMVAALRRNGHQLHVLRLTPDGVPMHPLARGKAHIPEDVVPAPWPAP